MANQLISKVSERIEEMKRTSGLETPPNYSVGNALQSAYLKMQDTVDRYQHSVLETCTTASISQSLLNMVIQGLTPVKNQCYFIAYGNKLTMQPSYFGNVTALKRLDNVANVHAEVIFKDDEFETGSDDNFNLVVKSFNPKFENRDKPIIGAFAVITDVNGNKTYTVMTMNEINQSWNQTRMKKNKVQESFGQEMAKRTVLNRAAKFYVNTSDDSDLLAGAINESTADEYNDDRKDVTPAEDSALNKIANKNKEKKTVDSKEAPESEENLESNENPVTKKKAPTPQNLIKDFEEAEDAKRKKKPAKKVIKKDDKQVEPTSVTDKGVEKSNAENEKATSEQESLGLNFNPDKQ